MATPSSATRRQLQLQHKARVWRWLIAFAHRNKSSNKQQAETTTTAINQQPTTSNNNHNEQRQQTIMKLTATCDMIRGDSKMKNSFIHSSIKSYLKSLTLHLKWKWEANWLGLHRPPTPSPSRPSCHPAAQLHFVLSTTKDEEGKKKKLNKEPSATK